MRESDKRMLAGMTDLSGISPSGSPMKAIHSAVEPVEGNRAERRARVSNKRRKKQKFTPKDK